MKYVAKQITKVSKKRSGKYDYHNAKSYLFLDLLILIYIG